MDANLLLAVATLALVVGPLLDRLAARWPVLAALVDGATVGGIVVVSLLHLLPEAAAHLGWWALVLALAGLALPALTERWMARSWQGWRLTVGALVLVLFVLHLLFEGAALAGTANDERLALATVLVVAGHNLPLGLLLWGQTKARFGRAASIAVLAGTAALTWFGPLVFDTQRAELAAVCSALLAGGLLHLVVQHDPRARAAAPPHNAWSALGAAAAVTALIAYLGGAHGGHSHGDGPTQLATRFGELLLETAPPLLLGVIAAGLIEAWLPAGASRWLGRGSRPMQALRGVLLGAPMPVCSCGVLPIYRSLVRKRVPPAAALALLVAAPEIGVDSVLLSLPLLGAEATVARLGAALLLALLVGWFVGARMGAAREDHGGHGAEDEGGGRPTGLGALRRGLFETWGHLAPWILLGLYTTAFVEPHLGPESAAALPAWGQVLALSLIGLPTYICATAATPLAALLLYKGFGAGAVIAFLLTGPATNLTTFGALRRLHSTRAATLFVGTAFLGAVGIGLAVDLLLPGLAGPGRAPGSGADAHGFLAELSAAILVGLTLWILAREGPRRFLRQLGAEGGEHHHGPAG